MFGKKKEGAKPLRTAFKIKEKNKMDGGQGENRDTIQLIRLDLWIDKPNIFDVYF